MADKGEYGEPRFVGKPRHGGWQHRTPDDRFVLDVMAFGVEHEDGAREAARVRAAANSMRGIADPEQFMADVRAAIADWESGQVAGSDHRDRYMARLAAQLKGGE